jgi:hypothetical protein
MSVLGNTMLMTSTSASNPPFPTSGLIAYYKLRSDMVDSINARNGSATSPVYNPTGGPTGQGSYVFNANANSVITLPNMIIGGARSWRFLIKDDHQAGASPNLFQEHDNNTNFIFSLLDSNAKNTFKYTRANVIQAQLTQSVAVSLNTWTQFIFSVDTNNARAIMDGRTAVTDNTVTLLSGSLNSVVREIGRYVASGSIFKGEMAEIAIWNRQLTTQEEADLYNGGNFLTY